MNNVSQNKSMSPQDQISLGIQLKEQAQPYLDYIEKACPPHIVKEFYAGIPLLK